MWEESNDEVLKEPWEVERLLMYQQLSFLEIKMKRGSCHGHVSGHCEYRALISYVKVYFMRISK